MKKIVLTVSLVAISIMVIFSLSSCASIAQRAVANAIKTATGASVNLSNGQVNVTDSSGNQLSIGSNKVPANWPSAVPVNDKITIQLSSSGTDSGETSWTLSGTFTGSGEDLYNYYKGQLSSWSSDSDTNSNSNGTNTWLITLHNDKYTFYLMVNDDGKTNKTFLLVVGEQPSSETTS